MKKSLSRSFITLSLFISFNCVCSAQKLTIKIPDEVKSIIREEQINIEKDNVTKKNKEILNFLSSFSKKDDRINAFWKLCKIEQKSNNSRSDPMYFRKYIESLGDHDIYYSINYFTIFAIGDKPLHFMNRAFFPLNITEKFPNYMTETFSLVSDKDTISAHCISLIK